MIQWIDSHGVTVLAIYMAIVYIAGTVPPLPDGASFMQQWAYTLLKTVALNSRAVGKSLGINLPEIQIPGAKKLAAANANAVSGEVPTTETEKKE